MHAAIEMRRNALPTPVTPALPVVRGVTVGNQSSLRGWRKAWMELDERARVEHPFCSHPWMSSWWDAFGTGSELALAAAMSGDSCVGLAPLRRRSVNIYGVTLDQLEMLSNVHSPRTTWMTDPNYPDAFEVLWAQVQRLNWDVLVLAPLDTSRALTRKIKERAEADRLIAGVWKPRPSPYIRLSGSFDDFMSGLGRKFRRNVRNRIRRVQGLEPRMEVLEGAAVDAESLQQAFEIEAAAWKGARGTAILSDDSVRRFYVALAANAARNLRLYFLRVAGSRVAFAYCLEDQGSLFVLKQGYDPNHALYSPSLVLQYLMIAESFERRLTRFDFLGDDEEWKLRWTQDVEEHEWLYLFRRAPRPLLAHLLKFSVVPWAKDVLHKHRE